MTYRKEKRAPSQYEVLNSKHNALVSCVKSCWTTLYLPMHKLVAGHLQAVGGAREEGPRARQGDQEDVGGGHLRVGREGERALRGHGEAQGRFVGLE